MTTRVDVHSHHYPPVYLEALARRTTLPRVYRDGSVERFVIFPEEEADPRIGREITNEWRTVEGKTDFMDANGIARAMISLGNPWLEPFDGTTATDLTRQVNKEMGELEEVTSGRLVGLGALPATSVEAALDETRHIDDHPSLRGLVTGPRIAQRELDDPALEPLWDELEKRRLPVLLHPQDGVALEHLEGFGHVLPVGIGFPMETTVAVCRLIFAGVLHAHPDLRLVVSHGGGTLSSLVGRLDAAWLSDNVARRQLPEPPSHSIRRLYVDAITYAPGPLRAAMEMVGTDKIMFGTDHPFSIENTDATIAAIEQTLESGSQQALFAGTANDLFRLE